MSHDPNQAFGFQFMQGPVDHVRNGTKPGRHLSLRCPTTTLLFPVDCSKSRRANRPSTVRSDKSSTSFIRCNDTVCQVLCNRPAESGIFIHQPKQCLPVYNPHRRRFGSLNRYKVPVFSEQNPYFIKGLTRTYQPDNLFPPPAEVIMLFNQPSCTIYNP